tara:strand:- start:925 stop:1416 length:492 start_codon:yes stop_codon:yes gene_type:complete
MIYLTFFLLVWIGCAFFCGEVAKEKGYGGTSWFIGGLFFGIFALIASAGLPDRKLRRYIRLIGEKQNAIEVIKENKQLQLVDGNTRVSFSMPKNSSKEDTYKELVDVLKSGGCKLGEYNIKSYDFFESALGSKEFIVNSEEQDSLIILDGKEKGNQITWLGKI